MLKKLKFVVVFIIALIATWYAAEGIYWLATVLKPMTPFVMVIERIFIHLAFIVIAIYAAIFFSE